MRHWRLYGLKKNKFLTWIQNYEKRYTNVICGEINTSKTKEINLRGKIMWNWETRWLSWRKDPSKHILIGNAIRSLGVKIFYKTVKPFLSDKGTGSSGSSIILREDDVLITDPIHVADVFNTHIMPPLLNMTLYQTAWTGSLSAMRLQSIKITKA